MGPCLLRNTEEGWRGLSHSVSGDWYSGWSLLILFWFCLMSIIDCESGALAAHHGHHARAPVHYCLMSPSSSYGHYLSVLRAFLTFPSETKETRGCFLPRAIPRPVARRYFTFITHFSYVFINLFILTIIITLMVF